MPKSNPAVSAARTDESIPEWQRKAQKAERKLHLELIVLPPMVKKSGSTSAWGGTKIPMAKTKLQAENYAKVIASYSKPTSPPPKMAEMRHQSTGGLSDVWYDKTGPRERKFKTRAELKAEKEAREKARAEERKRIDALNRSRLGRMFKGMPQHVEMAAKVCCRPSHAV